MKPSEVTDAYWVYSQGPGTGAPPDSTYAGKWLLYAPVSHVDSAWAAVASATEAGDLGISAKCAAKGNPNARSTAVICVYTRDCRELGDVRRALGKLRELGFSGRLYYKEDLATLAGSYQRGQASLYESPAGTVIRQRREITGTYAGSWQPLAGRETGEAGVPCEKPPPCMDPAAGDRAYERARRRHARGHR